MGLTVKGILSVQMDCDRCGLDEHDYREIETDTTDVTEQTFFSLREWSIETTEINGFKETLVFCEQCSAEIKGESKPKAVSAFQEFMEKEYGAEFIDVTPKISEEKS